MKKNNSKLSECTYSVEGMHCASCEILIEKKLLKQANIEVAEASTPKNQVLIEYEGSKPVLSRINKMFKAEGYRFKEYDKKFHKPIKPDQKNSPLIKFENGTLVLNRSKLFAFWFIGVSLLGIYIAYTLLQRAGLASLVSVDSSSALPAFFVFGLVAGISSCAALVGGLVLSMSKQWYELHSESNSFLEKVQPHFLFNLGRIISFTVLGGVLGAIGSIFQMSPMFTAIIAIFVAVMMTMLGLQILGVRRFQRFQFTVPKALSRYIADESNFSGKYMPFSMGALTFFLPCGFTITAQSLAMASGNPVTGGLIMSLFALGTSPMLLLIGMSSTKLFEQGTIAKNFMKIVGILVIVFGLTTFSRQLTVLGLPSLSDLNLVQASSGGLAEAGLGSGTASGSAEQIDLPPIVNGKQVVKMDASSRGYDPDYIRVRVNVPVRWEVNAKDISGCTNAIISNSLFDGQIKLTKGELSVKEFTPTKTGKYRFTCWMGMVKGIMEVVDAEDDAGSADADVQDDSGSGSGAGNSGTNDIAADTNDDEVIPSGAKGCGCGGGGGSGGSCGGK